MKARALTLEECAWLSEECHLLDEPGGDSQRDGLCLPNIFRSKKVRPLAKPQPGPAVYHTARELLLEALDRGAVQELVGRAAVAAKEQNGELSEEEYGDALTWFSVVLQSGLAVGPSRGGGGGGFPRLDGRQGVLKRNGFHSRLLALSRLEDGEKLEALAAFCGRLARRYQALHATGSELAVRKYRLSYGDAGAGTACPLQLAVLCEPSSGVICNLVPYCWRRRRRCSRKPVVLQVVAQLLRPFCGQRRRVHLDASACMGGELADVLSDLGVDVQFAPWTDADPLSPLTAHLRGWRGPALVLLSDLRAAAAAAPADVFLPGLWAALHAVCINTFVLHTRQSSGRKVQLSDFTRALACQLAGVGVGDGGGGGVPVLPRLHSSCCQDTSGTNLQRQSRKSVSSGGPVPGGLQAWSRPGVCGLDNSGNSCYLNAVLQCVCATVPLVEQLLSPDTRRELARSKCRVAESLVRLLEQMWLGGSSSCASVEARSVLCSVLPQFNNQSQQDAQELLLFLLDALHDDLKKVKRRQIRSHGRQLRPDEGGATMVSQLCEGRLSYTSLCMHCDQQLHSSQTFTVLSLPIRQSIARCSIQDCLSLFFEQTILTGGEQIMCSACELKRETTVFTCLDKPPEILILHLKRFGRKGKNQVKLRTNVAFSMKLDLSLFLSSTAQSASHSTYHLYAVVNHVGHLNMGHYTAVCHSALTQTWHCFDDAAVREVQDGLVQSADAYILLYSRRTFRKPKIHGLSAL